jgi:hypothetical protein
VGLHVGDIEQDVDCIKDPREGGKLSEVTFHRFFGHQRAAPYAACLADCCFNQVS